MDDPGRQAIALPNNRLTPAQQQVVTSDPFHGHILVIAPPGSGKTLTLTRRIEFLLQEGLAEPEQILALTFTRRAAGELIDRLATVRREGVVAGTFHAFSADFLNDRGAGFGIKLPVRILDEAARKELLDGIFLGYGLACHPAILRKAGNWLSQLKCGLSASPGVEEPPVSVSFGEQLADDYRHALREQGLLDFDDLILETNRILWESPEESGRLHERYRFVCIDEFHDVSPDQYRLVQAIAPAVVQGRQLLAVADSNQAIYAFRGANATESLAAFRRDYRPRHYRLTDNFRSTGRIVDASRQIINSGGAADESVSAKQEGMSVYCCGYEDDVEEAIAITSMVTRAIAGGASPGEVAILYRRHVRGDAIEQALIAARVPVNRIGPDRFFDQPMAQEAVRYLELMLAYEDRTFLDALNWPRLRVDELTMASVLRLARVRELSIVELAGSDDLLQQVCTPLTAVSVSRLMHEVIEPLAALADDSLKAAGMALLAALRANREAVPAADWQAYQDVLQLIGVQLESAPGRLRAAIDTGRPVVIETDGSIDAYLAGSLFSMVLRGYPGIGIASNSQQRTGQEVVLRFGQGAVENDDLIAISPLSGVRFPTTITARAFRLAQLLLGSFEQLALARYVVFDLETTSARPGSTELLQIGACVIEDGSFTGEQFVTLVRPAGEDSVTPAGTQVHGLRWQDVAEAPSPADAIMAFLQFAGADTLVGHNISAFDLPVLRRVAAANGIPWPDQPVIDTCLIARRLHPGEPATLDALLTGEERAKRGRHDALIDAQATASVFLRLADEVRDERIAASLVELLPLVAMSILLAGLEESDDNQILANAGAAAYWRGQGVDMAAEVLERLPADERARLEGWLRERGEAVDAADRQWQLFGDEWQSALSLFTVRQQESTVASFLNFVHLLQPIDLDRGGKDRVVLMTIHAAKGQEWDVVILAGAEENELVFGGDAESVDEGRRVLYVGMTRARHRLIVTWVARFGMKGHRLSDFIRVNLDAFERKGKTRELH